MSNEIVNKYCEGRELDREEMFTLFQAILENQLKDDEIKNFLVASSKRLPTAEELTGAAKSLRINAQQLSIKNLKNEILIDTCGTGGSGLDAFNTSTVASFILSSVGIYVVKHGNRAATSKCGSADLLTQLGAKIDLSPNQASDCLERAKFTFLFAPHYHLATRRVQLLRRELGIKTIFNYLGPLSNPANPPFQLLGVSNQLLLRPVAEALANLGLKKALVVCGEDGLDEITLTSKTNCLILDKGKISQYVIDPVSLGLPLADPEEIKGSTPDVSVQYLFDILENKPSARANLVKLNAAAGFWIVGKCSNLEQGLVLAEKQLANGEALASLSLYLEISKSYEQG